MAPPLSVIKIVKYCGVGGGVNGTGPGGVPKDIGAPSLSVIKIVKYCWQKLTAYIQYTCILLVTN